MSFILDALKKSEETRSDNPLTSVGRQSLLPPRRKGHKPLLWTLAIVIPVLFLAIGWWLGQAPGRFDPAIAQVTATTEPPAPANTGQSSEKAATITENAQPEATMQRMSSEQAQRDNVAIYAPIPKRNAQSRTQDTIPSSTPPENPVPEPARHTERPQAIPKFVNLPPGTRQDIGPMQLSLHFFSPDPARRMIRLNGVILNEGESVNDNLVVEEIKESSTIFSYGNQRFELQASGRQ